MESLRVIALVALALLSVPALAADPRLSVAAARAGGVERAELAGARQCAHVLDVLQLARERASPEGLGLAEALEVLPHPRSRGVEGDRDQAGSGPTSADAGETASSSAQSGQAVGAGTAPGTQGTVGAGAGAGDADIDHSAYGAPGGKLPPPQDDDIVARQLREAAEKETDPELKKKLWEEYWKYKGVKKGE